MAAWLELWLRDRDLSYLFGLSMAIWGNFEDESFEQDTHFHLGTNIHAFGSSGHLKLHAGVWSPGKRRPSVLEIGPVLYWRFTDLWHFQTKWQYRRHKEPAHSTSIVFA